ncbi:DUF5686 and carboxypeptidase-like regulatory domain-containing protein [Siphonobacter curvatus]|uniref:Carboxypeptidase-like regulatory domain-containing protein n=1 Tax=Siphonobacter curvatus TaxID=2094562 RepID=A0A2S7IJ43_9BACT|nr:DUF5686 and carboxypeptidase-like regulatory domain-containing protein [Siphonobacter curvatus]PQA56285.1 hypothetical protein C5O19_18240 [Siphonobacter curvatus]
MNTLPTLTFPAWMLWVLGFLLSVPLHGQVSIQEVSGQITDQKTGQAIPFASVGVLGKPSGTVANEEGRYQLRSHQPLDSLLISAVGYQTTRVAVTGASLSVALLPATATLSEVVIRAGENPAFRILKEVHARRTTNDFRQLSGYTYEAYSQLSVGITQMDERFQQLKPVRTILQAVPKESRENLPVFASETVSRVYARRHPQLSKEEILKTNISSVGITDDSFIAMFTGAGFNTINFYENEVSLFRKAFVSPLASHGRQAYTYFLADTTQIEGRTCYTLEFDPKQEHDLVFRGRLFIDTLTYALAGIDARLGAEANINFIKGIDLSITYELSPAQVWIPSLTQLTIQASEVVKHTFGARVEYATSLHHFTAEEPRNVRFFSTNVELAADRQQASDAFWQEHRERMPSQELEKSRHLIDTVRNVPLVKKATQAAELVLNGGYLPVVKGLETGSVFSAWAYNRVEGHRLRWGLQTNASFSKTWQLSAYAAYGTRDQVWKRGGEIRFIPKRAPLTLVTLRHTYDLEQVGLRLDESGDDPFLKITNRFSRFRQAYYWGETVLAGQQDLGPNFTQTVGIRQQSLAFLFPIWLPASETGVATLTNLWTRELFIETRYAPGRLPNRRVNNRKVRQRPAETAPIVTLRYQYGTTYEPSGASSSYPSTTYHKWQLQLDHAVLWGLGGRTNYTVRAGYTPSTLPYPLLTVHQGNPTPFYNRSAFNLMQYAEFVSDRYVSLAVEHKFEGLFTNRIPLIRYWGWRNFITGKVLYGQLSAANQRLLIQPEGKPGIESLQSLPYVELGYGFENVFRIARIEALHRLTYRDHPNAQRFAIKVSFPLGL